ncbi:MAG: DNA primase [Clostridia bacterium]|nr:DNA primase [Clostridia bacterium]
MAYISQEIIDEIIYRNNIEDVVSGYVNLKRAGSNYVGLCPFHSEKTPSFTVFPANGNCHCFGCGAGGDVINFIRRVESLDYREALELLAKRAGIEIPEDDRDKSSAAERSRILEMNKEAAKFFHDTLIKEENGKNGREYFAKRGLSRATVKHFGLGYAPESWTALTSHLSKLGYKDYEMSKAFLCGISKNEKSAGRPFDYFRNRVIFPIIDTAGNVIAFGGRVLDDSKPKYLNTSDTPAFKKSKNLFALNFAKKACSESLILCEGYMDVIALHAAGFENAVATLGTAMTADHARLMKKYTKSVLISYDSDEAGQRAANRAFELLGEVGLEARIIKMSGAKDPDEYIKKFGADNFRALLRGARSEFDYKFDTVISKYDINTDDGRVAAIRDTEKIISAVQSSAERDVYIHRAAEKLSVTPESMKADIERSIRSRAKKQKTDETKKIMSSAQGIGDRVNRDYVKNPAAGAAEDQILGILMIHPEYYAEAKKSGRPFTEDRFFTEFSKRVIRAIESLDGEFSEARLGEFLELEEIERLSSLKMKRSSLSNNTYEIMLECFDALERATAKKEASIEDIIKAKKKKTEDKI